ncbi:MAG: GNAT family N-acetyltransferase [Clostridiales bacterium]|jgi:diamine N-acetyltransferase|nr:GNAT family N-acetyltransferase [Clostridiales bacterium]
MIFLKGVNEGNWYELAKLQTTEEQKKYVASAVGIMARAYAMRKSRAKVYAIVKDEIYIGIAMVRDMDEYPECYELQQFFIDYRYQNQGYGKTALKLIIDVLEQEKKYASIEVCVKMEDKPAIHVYEILGFEDTKYISPDVPDAYNLRYRFKN